MSGGGFGRVAAMIDEAEGVAWSRLGGPTNEDRERVEALERRLAHLKPGPADWEWTAKRLARAIENGWHGGPLETLLKLAA